jgi:hypothetical protein
MVAPNGYRCFVKIIISVPLFGNIINFEFVECYFIKEITRQRLFFFLICIIVL